jgi:hypothetical protein
MGELYRHTLNFLSTLLSHFAFVPPSRCFPVQMLVAVGTRPVALGVMLVVFSVQCFVYRLCLLGKRFCMLHVYSKDEMCRHSPVYGRH